MSVLDNDIHKTNVNIAQAKCIHFSIAGMENNSIHNLQETSQISYTCTCIYTRHKEVHFDNSRSTQKKA